MPTWKHQALLLRGLVDGERAYVGPAYVGMGISGRCNLNCLGCQYHSSQNRYPEKDNRALEMPLELAERVAQQLVRSGTRLVLVAGTGEPLTHPQWFDVLSVLRRAGLEVRMTTNGTLIDEAAADRLMTLDLQSVSVSTWALTPEAFAILCPGVDVRLLERKLEGLRFLARAKARHGAARTRVHLKSTVNRHTYAHLGDMVRLAHELGCDSAVFSPYQDWGGEFEPAALTPEEIAGLVPELSQVARLAGQLSLRHNVNSLLTRYRLGAREYASRPCYSGWCYTNIRSGGTVNPCAQCTETVGDLRQDSFEQIWNGAPYRAFRRSSIGVGGPASPGSGCVCTWCCHWRDNRRIHRRFRWLAPLIRRTQV